jgi:hypothetical protein
MLSPFLSPRSLAEPSYLGLSSRLAGLLFDQRLSGFDRRRLRKEPKTVSKNLPLKAGSSQDSNRTASSGTCI